LPPSSLRQQRTTQGVYIRTYPQCARVAVNTYRGVGANCICSHMQSPLDENANTLMQCTLSCGGSFFFVDVNAADPWMFVWHGGQLDSGTSWGFEAPVSMSSGVHAALLAARLCKTVNLFGFSHDPRCVRVEIMEFDPRCRHKRTVDLIKPSRLGEEHHPGLFIGEAFGSSMPHLRRFRMTASRPPSCAFLPPRSRGIWNSVCGLLPGYPTGHCPG
jgi:hypothetical protein